MHPCIGPNGQGARAARGKGEGGRGAAWCKTRNHSRMDPKQQSRKRFIGRKRLSYDIVAG